jgi:hypothetical protein
MSPYLVPSSHGAACLLLQRSQPRPPRQQPRASAPGRDRDRRDVVWSPRQSPPQQAASRPSAAPGRCPARLVVNGGRAGSPGFADGGLLSILGCHAAGHARRAHRPLTSGELSPLPLLTKTAMASRMITMATGVVTGQPGITTTTRARQSRRGPTMTNAAGRRRASGRGKKRLGPVFWAESVMASFTAVLAVLTLAWRDWIEGVFGFAPDHHNGSFEWELIIVCAMVTVLFGALAAREWRKAPLRTALASAD